MSIFTPVCHLNGLGKIIALRQFPLDTQQCMGNGAAKTANSAHLARR
jgi:hypothetical protein